MCVGCAVAAPTPQTSRKLVCKAARRAMAPEKWARAGDGDTGCRPASLAVVFFLTNSQQRSPDPLSNKHQLFGWKAPIMPLYVIGLGLGDERDVTVKGAEAIKKCSKVFLESYTSILSISKERLEAAFGVPIQIAWRETVESEAHLILEPAKTSDVAFLVVGDPFGATTHTDLLLRAQDEGIETCVTWLRWTGSRPGVR